MQRERYCVTGFSTPEVLLSVFVVSIGLVTIIAVMAGSIRYSFAIRDTVIATDLAQEGVELIRNVRDNDFAMGGTGFVSFSVPPARKHCRIDWNDPDSSLDCQANRGADSRYYLQYVGGFYGHVNVSQERFSRYVFIDYSSAGGERALVRSFVFWGGFSMGSIPATGAPDSCAASSECVYTETFLTAWK